ncbi:MAG: ligase-associated DNA damage response endonuclease PdeM [Croceivirga sp.]
MTVSLIFKNVTFTLHPHCGVFWEAKSLLLISDVHLGKVGHFRKFGAAVPRKAIHKNFLLLDELVGHFQPFHIVFLGDLFHSSLNKEWNLFENWVEKTASKITLIAGNHDIISPEKFRALDIEIFEELVLENFFLTHHPEEREGLFNFCGHIHPSIRLKGFGRQHLKLACFFKTKTQLILPAFGEFTGSYSLSPKKEDEIFVIVEGSVVKI